MQFDVIKPGARIGILGGGQLGRMTAIAAAQLGYHAHIFCPDPLSPAFEVSGFHTCAQYTDEEALAVFASKCDVVTYEFENVPLGAASIVSANALLRPGIEILRLSQNRIREKEFANQHGIAAADFRAVKNADQLRDSVSELSRPCILKTCEFGYDGKGQIDVAPDSDFVEIWRSFGSTNGILEARVPFEREISAIVARNSQGICESFPVSENSHKAGILRTSKVPAEVTQKIETRAQEFAMKLACAANVVGLLAVEFFVLPDGELIFNEMAPRPHNSGHWTLDGCMTSQFEQLVRAICNLPFSSTRMTSEVTMENLIGFDLDSYPIEDLPIHAKLHLYGKSEIRAGRKMGHINYLNQTVRAL